MSCHNYFVVRTCCESDINFVGVLLFLLADIAYTDSSADMLRTDPTSDIFTCPLLYSVSLEWM
jgi:hypothetical protein